MEKRFFLLSIVLFSFFAVFASNPKESKTRYYRHEVNIGIGRLGIQSGWGDDYAHSVMNHFGMVAAGGGMNGVVYEWSDDPQLGGSLRAVSYYYHLNRRIAIGGLLGGWNVDEWLGYPADHRQEAIQKTGYTDIKGTSFFLMPSVKLAWLNNQWCSLYLKATGGFHYQSLHLDSESIPNEQTDEYKKKHLGFSYYLTPFGWEIGKQKVRWFIEFGIGGNTNFQTGLTYRFCRY